MTPAVRDVVLLGGGHKWILPGASIDMDFANSRYFGGALASLLSTSRASNGYAQDLAGNLINFGNNVPRITNQGLLIEEARTNLCLQSQAIDNASWLKLASGAGSIPTVTADVGVAPDGTTTADRIQFALNGGSTTGDLSRVLQTFTVTNGVSYTVSAYLKSNTGSNYILQLGDSNTSGANVTNVTVTPVWQKLSFVVTTNTTTAAITLRLQGAKSNSDSADVLAWGFQYELGSFPTSYIPTTTASATRAADVITLIGNAATASLSAKAGYFQTNFGPISANSARLLQYENNSATNEGLLFISTNTTVQGQNASGTGSGGATLGGGTNTATSPVKSAFGFDAASITAIANGGTKASGANAWDVSVATRAILGNRTAGDRPLNGYMQRFALSPTKGAFDGLTAP